MTDATHSPGLRQSDTMWARPDDDQPSAVDDRPPINSIKSVGPNDRTKPATEFTAIFGDPTAWRALGDGSIGHHRRGSEAVTGGGDTLDRRRKGSSDDVLVTLLAHPASSADQAVNGSALTVSRRLHVDIAGRRSERRDLVFDAALRTFLWRRRPARLRLYGSASMNVTILTLTPAQARRRPSRWFVRSGYRTMERVAEQLAAEVEPLRWQPLPDA